MSAVIGARPHRPVLGEEDVLEVRLAADDVNEALPGRGRDDRTDLAGDPHPDEAALGHGVADTRQTAEQLDRDWLGEQQLDVVERELADRLDAIDLDEAALADDRDPVAGPVDLVDDVRRQEDRPAVGAGFADELEERLLDERVEPGRRLVEDEQVRLVLERHDQPDLLLVALGVLAEAPARVEVEPLDQVVDVGAVDPAAQVREVGDGVGAGQAVVQVELARQVADPPMDRDRVDGRLDAEHRGPAAGRTDEVEQDPHRRRLARAVGSEEPEDLALADLEVEVDDAAVRAVRLREALGLDDGDQPGFLRSLAAGGRWRSDAETR